MSDLQATAGAEPVATTDEPLALVEQAEGSPEGTKPEGEPKAELTDAEKAAKALQRRVDRLTRDRYRERAEMAAEIERLRTTTPPKTEQPEGEAPQLTQKEVERLADERAAQIAEAKAFNDKCNKVFEEGKKLSATFGDDLRSLAEEVGPLFDKNQRPTPFMEAVLDADAPAKLLKHFAANPEIASEIADLSPRQQIRRIALLEQSMGEATKPKPSTAPKPVSPVNGGGGGTGEPDATKNPSAWIKWRNEQSRH